MKPVAISAYYTNWIQTVTQPREPNSVSMWIRDLKSGDDAVADQLWNRYFSRLVGLARKHLGKQPRRVADEEDVALSVFKSLCRGTENGNFSGIPD